MVTAPIRGSAISRRGDGGDVGLGDDERGEQPVRRAGRGQRRRCTARAQPVVFGECLSSAALPAMSAGAAKRSTCHSGKFHGMTASTTPTGS